MNLKKKLAVFLAILFSLNLFAQAPATVAVFSGVPGLRIQLFPGIASELFFRGF
jgi:hypothetical protein